MSFKTIRIDVDGRGVATLELAREGKHNAFDATMIAELTAAAASLGSDEAVRVVVLKGKGRSFCAGGDLEWMGEQFTATRQQRMDSARALADMLRALDALPKPLIASVHGNAYGGGVGLLCVSDCVVAAETATFALTETKLGLIPATIGPYVVSRVGEGAARHMFLAPRNFKAGEARAAGLVHIVCAPPDLGVAVEAECRSCLDAAPHAAAAAKALVRSLRRPIDDGVIAATIDRLADIWEHPQTQQMVARFFERRT